MISKKLIVLLLIPFVFSCKKEKNRICELYSSDIEYSIGKISSLIKVPLRVDYRYDFSVNQLVFNGVKKSYGIGQDDASLIGKSFLVVYDRNNPKNSDLNFSYSIKDSTDFKQYLVSFQTQKPSFSFPRNCK